MGPWGGAGVSLDSRDDHRSRGAGRYNRLTSVFVAAWFVLAGCARPTAAPTLAPPFEPTLTPGVTPPPTLAAATATLPATAVPASTGTTAPAPQFSGLTVPLVERSAQAAASLKNAGGGNFTLVTGDYQLDFGPAALPSAVLLTRAGSSVGLALLPLGADYNLLAHVTRIVGLDDPVRPGVRLVGSVDWADFSLWIWVYPHNPGLVYYHFELARRADVPPGSVAPEWTFVDPTSGAEAAAGFSPYAEKSEFASPSFYGQVGALDSTLLAWVDVTRLTPFIQATHFSPNALPVRQGRKFGSNFGSSDLGRLPLNTSTPLYDGYIYLAPGTPADEAGMFLRYLQQVADIYDVIGHPDDPLPDWQDLARRSLTDLQDPDTWVKLNGKRYWRAYVADTRQSAEAITQLDVGLGAARYAARYGPSDLTQSILGDVLAGAGDFYNPAYGLVQNSGPLAVSGNQTRGDTWYELGHALKLAELGLLGYDSAAKLARDSQAAWISFAHAVNYKFPQFYTFNTWKGTGQEPDAGGGYALYMLRMADLGCGQPCVQEAESAVRAFPGHGFAFSYETHMTAMSALAAAELADRTHDDSWLAYANGPIANLLRLSWIYEADFGQNTVAHTFFGLGPTQRSGVITAKEQYEAWIYLSEFLRRAHGRIDPSVEKLLAEFCYHSLITLANSLPPRLAAGQATQHPAAYQTVATNRLDLYIPLEDMRDGQNQWGAIGQEVYGAGMAPTFAALAYVALAPGVTLYSGYPVAKVDGLSVTFTGVPGSFAPVSVSAVASVMDAQGRLVKTDACRQGLCFLAEGGGTYAMKP
jgi:hypothetical protein